MPFHISFAFRADPTGRVAMLIPAMQLLGSALGPLVASLMLHQDNPGPVPYVSLAFALASMILLCAGQAKVG